MQKIAIYTDGGARGNPGPAGAGAVITDSEAGVLREVSKFLGHQTNNVAEYEAVILALEELKKIIPKAKRKTVEVVVKMDSELVVRQMAGKYQVKEPKLFPQYMKIHNIRVAEFPKLTFMHIRREQNKDADRLANEAMDKGA